MLIFLSSLIIVRAKKENVPLMVGPPNVSISGRWKVSHHNNHKLVKPEFLLNGNLGYPKLITEKEKFFISYSRWMPFNEYEKVQT